MAIPLRTARRLKGLSQDELSALSGVPQQTISKLERRGAQAPTWNTAWKLAQALGIEAQELFDVPSIPEPAQPQEIER
jgi:transcriptional regulator with XRE-family HTH domain